MGDEDKTGGQSKEVALSTVRNDAIHSGDREQIKTDQKQIHTGDIKCLRLSEFQLIKLSGLS